MNIWYISKYAITPEAGQPTRQFFLSNYMAKAGHNVTLFSSVSSGIKKRPPQANIEKKVQVDAIGSVIIDGPLVELGFSLKRIFSWPYFEKRLRAYIKANTDVKPDVIIVSSLSLLTFLTGVYLKRKLRCKLIIEVRDIWPLTLIEIGKLSKYNPFVKFLAWVEKYGYSHADGIVGSMPLLNEHVASVMPKLFKFKCIPMGFDPAFYADVKEQSVAVTEIIENLPASKFIVGYAGSIGVVNLVEEILIAAKLLNNTHSNIHFVFIGDGPLKAELQHKYRELNNVSFYSKIGKRDVLEVLKACDLLVNCWQNQTIYRYGVSPNKWMDYMLSAKPILTAYGGYQSIINEAECGFFIPPNQPELLSAEINRISQMDKVTLAEMGQRGFDFVNKYHKFGHLADEYLKFINKV